MKTKFVSGLLIALTLALAGCDALAPKWEPAPNAPVYDRFQYVVINTFNENGVFRNDLDIDVAVNAEATDELGNYAEAHWYDENNTPRNFPAVIVRKSQFKMKIEYATGWKVNVEATAGFNGEAGWSILCAWADVDLVPIVGSAEVFVRQDIDPKTGLGHVECNNKRTFI